jgi:hypothetical protein
MKSVLLFTALITFVCGGRLVAQVPPALQKPFAILIRTYPHVEAKRFVRAPADSAWHFRADSSSIGSVEVGFQGDQVVYMVFRRGVGGVSWKRHEIDALHDLYCKESYTSEIVATFTFLLSHRPSMLRLLREKISIQRHSCLVCEQPTNTSNQTMQRTAGSLGSLLFMKFHPQPAATRHSASRR